MSNEKVKKDNRSPAQKLGDLELGVSHLFQTSDLIGKDVSLLKSAMKLLDNKLTALIKATTSGEEVTDSVLDRIMIENNVADLANRVTNMVVNGLVVAEDQVTENSFIVGNEISDDGAIVNPRIQFALKALAAELQGKLLGAKPGDKLKFKDDATVSFQVLETYHIQDMSAPAPAAEEAPATPEEVPDASASAAPSEDPASNS